MRRSIAVGIPIAGVIAGLAFAGCGGGGNDGNDEATESGAATAAQTTGGGNELTIKMDDYSFTPKDTTANAGAVTISTPNDGQVQHELVLLQTDQSPTSLPKNGDEVDEEALETKGVESPGEIEEVNPGQTKSGNFQLTPGKYLMICNLPGHFNRGMYGTITVK